ncbi:unnamed protein product [Durusdinium trenchii]|uniref:Uncharacterized protein n=1 Tax=Durusdinium trenchii TaxID=1381693 RepID=A0ABP0JQ66_9DINO
MQRIPGDQSKRCASPREETIMVILHDYMDEWGGESVTDTGGVTDALYNPTVGEFYTVSKQTVKTWNANTGVLFKVLRDITQDEITAACVSDNGRKIYLGDSKGRVQSFGLQNGAPLSVFDQHPTDISCLTIWKGTNKVFSSSWDGTVKIHTDEGSRSPQLKAEFKNHRDGVTCLRCSPELLLFASGGTDMQVVLYDLKTMKYENALARFQHVIAAVDFLPKRCLLIVADQGGHLSFWRMRPHPEQWTCIFHFRNLPIINGVLPSVTEMPPAAPAVPVCALRVSEEQLSLPSEEGGEEEIIEPPLIYTADSKGVLRVWTVSAMPLGRRSDSTCMRATAEGPEVVELDIQFAGCSSAFRCYYIRDLLYYTIAAYVRLHWRDSIQRGGFFRSLSGQLDWRCRIKAHWISNLTY